MTSHVPPMAFPDDSVAHLQDAGLTQYQARAYVTLLHMGAVRVLPLSRTSGVPRNKLYHVLADLVKDGLVEVVQEEPLEYRALPLRPYLERRMDRLRALLEQFSTTPSWNGRSAAVPSEPPAAVAASGYDDADRN